MDPQPVEVDAVEEMEEPEEVPKDHDHGRTRAGSCASDMDTDESMAISNEEGGPIRPEYEVVQLDWIDLS
jgi:hypothetical protein